MTAPAGAAAAGGSDPVAVVERYFAALGPTREAFWSSFDTFFDDATVWENVGLGCTVGRDEAVAFARQFPVDFDYMTVDVLHIAAAGDTVLTERIDYLHDAQGAVVATVRVAGTFLIDGDVIREWRDYYDTAGFAEALAAA